MLVGRGGLRGTKIVNKHFVNKWAFPKTKGHYIWEVGSEGRRGKLFNHALLLGDLVTVTSEASACLSDIMFFFGGSQIFCASFVHY